MFSKTKSPIIIFRFQIKICVKTIFIFFCFKLDQIIRILNGIPGPNILSKVQFQFNKIAIFGNSEQRLIVRESLNLNKHIFLERSLLCLSDWEKEQPPTPVQNQNVLALSQHIPRAEPPPKKLFKNINFTTKRVYRGARN